MPQTNAGQKGSAVRAVRAGRAGQRQQAGRAGQDVAGRGRAAMLPSLLPPPPRSRVLPPHVLRVGQGIGCGGCGLGTLRGLHHSRLTSSGSGRGFRRRRCGGWKGA